MSEEKTLKERIRTVILSTIRISQRLERCDFCKTEYNHLKGEGITLTGTLERKYRKAKKEVLNCCIDCICKYEPLTQILLKEEEVI